MKFGELISSGKIKMTTHILLSTDLGSGITTPDTLGEMPLWQFAKYADREVISLSGVKDRLNIIIEDDYMLS